VCLAKAVPWGHRSGLYLSRLVRASYHGAVGKEGLESKEVCYVWSSHKNLQDSSAMRLPRVRFSMRSLMIFVVGMAAILGSATMYRRHLYCREVAEFYDYQAAFFAERMEFFRKMEADAEFTRKFGVSADDRTFKMMAADHESSYTTNRDIASRMAETAAAFRRVASRPWLAVPPGLSLPPAPN
jgi:hypothetical protein